MWSSSCTVYMIKQLPQNTFFPLILLNLYGSIVYKGQPTQFVCLVLEGIWRWAYPVSAVNVHTEAAHPICPFHLKNCINVSPPIFAIVSLWCLKVYEGHKAHRVFPFSFRHNTKVSLPSLLSCFCFFEHEDQPMQFYKIWFEKTQRLAHPVCSFDVREHTKSNPPSQFLWCQKTHKD